MGIKKNWDDPVWSKVIAAIIIAALTIIYNYVISQTQNIDFQDAFLIF